MRLFISIQFTDPMIDALEAFQSRLKASGVEGYYAARENLHLTLAFIGDYGEPDEVRTWQTWHDIYGDWRNQRTIRMLIINICNGM